MGVAQVCDFPITWHKEYQHTVTSALEMAKSELEIMEERIRASPTLSQDITGCITGINNHLSQYTVMA